METFLITVVEQKQPNHCHVSPCVAQSQEKPFNANCWSKAYKCDNLALNGLNWNVKIMINKSLSDINIFLNQSHPDFLFF